MTEQRPLTVKQTCFIEQYCNPKSETYNNAVQSAISAGYDKKWVTKNATHITDNNGVIEAINEYKANNKAKNVYNYDIAMQEINALIQTLTKQVEDGNIQAKGLLLASIKEKNDITGLHKQVIVTDTDQPAKLTESERIELKRIALQATNLRLTKEIA